MKNEIILGKAKPFLKWAGGKQQLLSQYEIYFPKKFNRYFEPFVGGGAVFFYLWNRRLITQNAYIFDINEELINVYCQVRDNVGPLIDKLAEYKSHHSEKFYYDIRGMDRIKNNYSDIERAARTLYLNKTCYNGLFRVNSKGQFNVPMGRYRNPQILYPEVLKDASVALRKVEADVSDYYSVIDLAESGDFVYFDPPYHPVSETANFTSYTANNFGKNDQTRLAELFNALTEKNCLCMLSNSDTPLINDLYQKYRPIRVTANRAINSKASKRIGTTELLIINFDPTTLKVIHTS